MRLVWSRRIGAPAPRPGKPNCIAAAIYNGHSLFIAGDETKVRGVPHRGSIRRFIPATGQIKWQIGLPNGVIGSPTVDGAGVIALGTDGSSSVRNAVYLIDAATGRKLRTLIRGSGYFAQPVFADGRLFTASGSALIAWHLRRR